MNKSFVTVLLVISASTEYRLFELNYTVSLQLPLNVVFNEKVQLKCIVYGTIANRTRQWEKGDHPPFETLSVDGIITAKNDKHRYDELVVFRNETSLVFILEIKNFSESDLKTYKCIFGIREQTKKLDWKEHFIYTPDKDTIVYYKDLKNSLDVLLKIPKVHPKPACLIAIEDMEINFTFIHTNIVGKFYEVISHEQLLIDQYELGDMVIVVCQVGPRRVQINPRHIINYKKDRWKIDGVSILVGAVIGVVIAFMVLIARLFWLQDQSRHETCAVLPSCANHQSSPDETSVKYTCIPCIRNPRKRENIRGNQGGSKIKGLIRKEESHM